MYCNGINFILIFLIIMMNVEILVKSQQYKKLQKIRRNTNQKVYLLDEGTNGDLYDIFQKRLKAIQNELSYHKIKDLDQQSARVQEKRHSLSEKSGITKTFNNENVKRLYEEYKKQMDKTYSELLNDGKKIFDPRKFSDMLSQSPNLLNFNTARDKLYQEFQNQLKSINSFMTLKQKRDYGWAAPYLNKDYNYYDENWLQDGENYDNLDWDYENPNRNYELWNLLPQKATTYSNLHRRQVITNNTSLYPSVLTKAVEISLNPTVHANSGGGLLAKVAEKMNTSALDLAEKLAKSTDNLQNNDQFTQMVQHFMTNNGANTDANAKKSVSSQIMADVPTKIANSSRHIIVQKNPISSPVQMKPTEVLQGYTENEGHLNEITTSSLTAILDRVLSKLDSIHDDKNKNEEEHPNGAPCDVTGSWSSLTLGLCFDIKFNNDKVQNVSPAEVNNKILSIEAQECTPPKSHHIIDLEWKFGGSAFKQLGGPFYIYTQKRSESLVGTFLGYCRTCAGIDTIFGSWTFVSPSKDCQDISLAFNVKRDLLRRGRMENKRKERFRDLLYQNRIGNT